MRSPGIVQRHPELRWLVSVGGIVAVVAVVSTSVSGVFRGEFVLPATNPQQLVAQVRAPHSTGYSGTIVTHFDLDLPPQLTSALATAVPVGGSLLDGTHTLRYWYGGAQRQRVAVIGPTAEQDVFRNGTNVLLWDTASRIAQRSTVADAEQTALPMTDATPAAVTPPQLASRILDVIGTAGDTTLRSGEEVADRATYELVLRPESASSRIDSVHIEIDGRQSVPLGVQIFAVGADDPAVDVSFTSVNFTQPAAQNFTFAPPADARERAGAVVGPLSPVLDAVSTVGTGWLRIAYYRAPTGATAVIAKALGPTVRRVKGRWGKGVLLRSPLLSILSTDRGRLLVGPVVPYVLYRAAAR